MAIEVLKRLEDISLWFSQTRAPAFYVERAYGEEDAPAGMLAMTVPAMARSASAVHARGVPHCGHSFAGETNGRILSKAYLWAFAGDDSFPSPDGGVPLYE